MSFSQTCFIKLSFLDLKCIYIKNLSFKWCYLLNDFSAFIFHSNVHLLSSTFWHVICVLWIVSTDNILHFKNYLSTKHHKGLASSVKTMLYIQLNTLQRVASQSCFTYNKTHSKGWLHVSHRTKHSNGLASWQCITIITKNNKGLASWSCFTYNKLHKKGWLHDSNWYKQKPNK